MFKIKKTIKLYLFPNVNSESNTAVQSWKHERTMTTEIGEMSRRERNRGKEEEKSRK